MQMKKRNIGELRCSFFYARIFLQVEALKATTMTATKKKAERERFKLIKTDLAAPRRRRYVLQYRVILQQIQKKKKATTTSS